MLEIISQIVANPLFQFLGFLIGLLGTYITIRYNRTKKLSYSFRSFSLIDVTDPLPLLKIHYDNEEIKRLTITRLLVWNSGNDTIEFAERDFLKVLLNDQNPSQNFLRSDVIQQPNNYEIKTICKFSEVEINVKNLYLNSNEGVIIQITHTGELHENIDIKCKIKGIKKPDKISYSKSRENTPIEVRGMVSAIVAMLVNFLIFLAINIKIVKSDDLIFIMVFTIWSNLTLIVLVELFVYRLILPTIPKEFQKFQEQSWRL
ncbi:MAG: hypothetical protein HEQ35_25160 [Gloeotrichia echinulata IR180]